jgi:hypothetical protein
MVEKLKKLIQDCVVDVMIMLLCITKYDAKHLQASKNAKKNKDKIVKNTRVYVCFQNNS